MARTLSDSSNTYIVNASAAPVTAYPSTIVAWVRPTSTGNDNCIVQIQDNTVTDNYFRLNKRTSESIQAIVNDGGGAVAASTTANITQNVYSHVAGVFTSSTSRAAYLNGGNKGTNTTSRTPTGINSIDIGREGDSSPGDEWDGDIAEVAIWDVALTDAEISLLHSTRMSPLLLTARLANLVFYRPLIRTVDGPFDIGIAMTDQSTTVAADHPPIYYPTTTLVVPEIAAGGGPTEVSLAGNKPASTGALSQIEYQIALAGSKPASSGTIAGLQTLLRSLAGTKPASTGTISALQTLLSSLAGNKPNSTGTISAQAITLVALAGNKPASTGALSAVVTANVNLAGSKPASTGTLSAQQTLLRSLAGSKPASTGALSALQTLLVALAGAKPSSTGTLALLATIALAGNKPASSGTVATAEPPAGPGGTGVPEVGRNVLVTDSDLAYLRGVQESDILSEADLDYMRGTQSGELP